MIKAVLFDMGNVLIHFDARKSVKAFAEALGVTEEQLWEGFFISSMEKSYTRGEISSEEFYEKAKEHFPGAHIDFETFKHLWNDIFTENKEMEDLLIALKNKYLLYLISNTNEMHFDHVKSQFGILKHFKKCFPSHEVGHRKPDRAMFDHVLEEIKLKPEDCVFVDDVQQFVDGAKALGIHGVLFTSRVQLEQELKKIGVQA